MSTSETNLVQGSLPRVDGKPPWYHEGGARSTFSNPLDGAGVWLSGYDAASKVLGSGNWNITEEKGQRTRQAIE